MKFRLFAIVCVCLPIIANASLINQGNTTFDTETNLVWLDVTETVGMTYSEVMSSSFILDQGYRYATEKELIAIYDHAGGSGNYYNTENGVPITTNYNAASLLIELMGCTSYVVGELCDQTGQDWHIGMFGPEVLNGTQTASAVDVFNQPDNRAGKGAIWLDYVETGPFPGRTQEDFGSYLVKSTVPEPTTFWLLGLGLIGLVGVTKRKRIELSAIENKLLL